MSKEASLKVAEHFLSIQGEGQTVGKRAVFLRLSGCVLDCSFCDTAEVWKTGKRVVLSELLAMFRVLGYTSHLKAGAHLVITGGDPLIQQKELVKFIDLLRGYRTSEVNHIEVETEGVLQPTSALCREVEFWNVSPKLANSNMPLTKRFKPDVLSFHANFTNAIFKFPVYGRNDLEEVDSICKQCNIRPEKVYLMPICDNRRDFDSRAAYVVGAAIERGYHFSPRLQLTIWNKAVGV